VRDVYYQAAEGSRRSICSPEMLDKDGKWKVSGYVVERARLALRQKGVGLRERIQPRDPAGTKIFRMVIKKLSQILSAH